MLGSNLAAHCFWIVKFKCWVGQEPWSKGLTHMTRGSIGLHERLVKITCHIWERESSKSSMSVPSCQQTFQFQLQKDKRLIMTVLHCICVALRDSWSRLPSTQYRAYIATAQVLHWQRQDIGAPPLFVLLTTFIFSRSTSQYRFSRKLFTG